jgi:hypothetical protein
MLTVQTSWIITVCVNAEIEFLQLLVKTCKTARDPQRRGSRTEMAIPAAQWEMKFEERIAALKQTAKSVEEVKVAA